MNCGLLKKIIIIKINDIFCNICFPQLYDMQISANKYQYRSSSVKKNKKTIPFDYQFIIFLKGFIYSPTRDTQLIPNHTPLWINQTDADKSTVGYNLNY